MQLPQKLSLDMMQTRWASILNPFIGSAFLNGLLLQNVALINGVTTINHLLGQQMSGWVISDINAAANIYGSHPLNGLTLTLTSDAACIVSIYVF